MADQAGCSEASVAVPVNKGVIIGKRQPASEAYPKPLDIFYGISYATAERFRPAQSCAPVDKGRVLDAQNEGKYVPCPMAFFETEEGTPRLNIFRPSKPPSDSSSGDTYAGEDTKLPVVVYIHGGAYMFGHPLERDLASLVAWAPRDVLVVAAGYRLGALGFKTGDGGEGDAGAELNLGLRDQRAAVDWVVRSMGRGVWRRGRRDAHGC